MPITEELLAWYDRYKRSLPWRGEHDPYAVWVSETMLQQTRVETVLSYYPRFMRSFPTLEALALAEEEAVLKQWEGLGYYRRARNLRLGAKQVMREYGGRMPGAAAELRKLHGIGEYTAGAIASIAFGEPVPAVDGNVIRVMARLMGIREQTDQPPVRREITRITAELVDPARPGDFNQALMDLGATVCTPGTPDCDRCPLTARCSAFARGDAALLPLRAKRTEPGTVPYDVLIIEAEGRVLMRQRTETMLQGLWVFPMAEGCREADDIPSALNRLTGLHARTAEPAGEARHVFTHRIWEMKIWILHTAFAEPAEGWRWVSERELAALPVPTAMRIPARTAREVLKKSGKGDCV